MSKRASGFNSPFSDLKLPAVPKPAPAPAPSAPARVSESDAVLFDKAMHSVAPLSPDPRGRLGSPGARLDAGKPPRQSRAADEAEAYAELADLVDGGGAWGGSAGSAGRGGGTPLFDVSATDEYIEGCSPGIDRNLVRKLRRGEYAVQAHLDLHGMVQTEARTEVEAFLDGARKNGHRCVLIVHGRGLHSKDSVPVLKERMKVWLSRGRIGKSVLAYASARPPDGGVGAVYVLLRR